MNLELSGRVVLISGGSRGIGAAIAEAFVREGARVIVTGRSSESLLALASRLGDGCDARVCDATDSRDAAALLSAIESDYGALDILITCTGSGASVPPGEETPEEWLRVMGVNVFSVTNMVQVSVPLLKRSRNASIVCISSICGVEALGAPVTYSAAKASLLSAVKGWSRPFGKMGVRINAISPGNIFTDGGTWDHKVQADPDGVAAMISREVPLGRFGTPAEIAELTLYLSSPLAAFITGANIVTDGGQTRSI